MRELSDLRAAQRDELEREYPGRFDFALDRDSFEYLYDADRLADLSGRRMHAKRNHIHRFDEQFPDWMAEPLSARNRGECAAFARAWYEAHPDMAAEAETLGAALSQESGEGTVIRAAGRVVGLALGSMAGPDCFRVEFEKAESRLQGAYEVLSRETARQARREHPGLRWICRPADRGVEGLRKARLSYFPDALEERYIAYER